MGPPANSESQAALCWSYYTIMTTMVIIIIVSEGGVDAAAVFPEVPKPIFRPSREHRLCDPDGGGKPGVFRIQGLGALVIAVHLRVEFVCGGIVRLRAPGANQTVQKAGSGAKLAIASNSRCLKCGC